MVAYKCFNCKKEVPENIRGRRVRCPFCDAKIFEKIKPEVSHTIKAR
jgi:DNA-directed RNA polymerase subunit RPC12/RpoP